MTQLTDLIARAEKLAADRGLAISTVSRKLFNDGKTIARLQSGRQCTLKTLAAAQVRLAELEAETKTVRLKQAAPAREPAPSIIQPADMTHLDRLEAEAIHIMREVAAECENPVMLYSVGKDSSVMLHLAVKAFYPSRPPFPLMHVDTTWKFREMIEFRDRMAKELGFDLIVHINEDGVRQGIGPFTHGSQIHTDVMKTQALKQINIIFKHDLFGQIMNPFGKKLVLRLQ